MRQITNRSVVLAALLLGFAAFAAPARAAFHLWAITEVYSNSSGSLQFIEMRDDFGSENFINGFQIVVSNVGNTQQHTFTVPGNPLEGETLDHYLLFGTAGLQAAGAPAPDYIIPNSFLFTGGGTISFFGLNGGGYGPLPIDGVISYTWPSGGRATNSPTNYAGETGVIPAPASLSGAAAGLWLATRRRRRAT